MIVVYLFAAAAAENCCCFALPQDESLLLASLLLTPPKTPTRWGRCSPQIVSLSLSLDHAHTQAGVVVCARVCCGVCGALSRSFLESFFFDVVVTNLLSLHGGQIYRNLPPHGGQLRRHSGVRCQNRRRIPATVTFRKLEIPVRTRHNRRRRNFEGGLGFHHSRPERHRTRPEGGFYDGTRDRKRSQKCEIFTPRNTVLQNSGASRGYQHSS